MKYITTEIAITLILIIKISILKLARMNVFH